MSLAISVTVPPSRWLLALTGAMCVMCAGVAPLVFFSDASIFPFFLRTGLALACLAAAFAAFVYQFSRRKTWRLDISGIGTIRLVEYVKEGETLNSGVELGREVTLLSRSTLWPWCLFLHLRDVQKNDTAVLIFRAEMPPESFRALTVVLRWIAVRHAEGG